MKVNKKYLVGFSFVILAALMVLLFSNKEVEEKVVVNFDKKTEEIDFASYSKGKSDLLDSRLVQGWKQEYGDKLKYYSIKTSAVNLPTWLYHPGIVTEDMVEFPEDAWLVAFEVLYEPSVLPTIHHINVDNLSQEGAFCRERNVIFAIGQEKSPAALPLGYGLFVGQGESLVHYVMYHNESDQEVKRAEVEIIYYYLSAKDVDLTPTWPVFLDLLDACGDSSFHIEPGEVWHKNSVDLNSEMTVDRDIKIIAQGAHFHNGGKWLKLLRNGDPIYTFEPVVGSNSEVLAIPPAPHFSIAEIIIRKGDKIGIEAFYDNRGRDREEDAMAQSMFFFIDAE